MYIHIYHIYIYLYTHHIIYGHDGNITLCHRNVHSRAFLPDSRYFFEILLLVSCRPKDFHTFSGGEIQKPIEQQRSTSDSSPQSFPLEKCGVRTLHFCPGAMNIHVQTVWLRLAQLLQAAPCSLYGQSDRCRTLHCQQQFQEHGSFGC